MIRGGLMVGAVLVGAVLWEPGVSAQPANPLLEQVKAAWAKRQDAVRTLRMTWSSKSTVPKGAYTQSARRRKSTGEIPAKDTVRPGTGGLILDGKKARAFSQGAIWDGDEEAFLPCRRESAFDGERYTSFHQTEPGSPTAIIKRSDHNLAGDELPVWPVLVAVRGLDPVLAMEGMYLGAYTQARRTTVEGRGLIELTRPRNETRGEGRMLVDPNQAYAVQRVEHYTREGHPTYRFIISHVRVPDPAGEWLPERWSGILYGPGGKLFEQVEVVGQTREVNPMTSAADFEVALPPGTRVVDVSAGKREDYIAREGGAKREILPSELQASHEELVRTNTGDLAPATARHRSVWLAAGALLVLLSLGLLLRRSFRRRSNPAS
jgi:hypothetical protein